MLYGDRIKKIRQTLKKTQTEFGKMLGINQIKISRLENNSLESIDFDILNRLKDININIDWIITGEGEKFRDTENSSLETNLKTTRFARVPIIDVRASAGSGVLNYMEEIKNYIEIPLIMLPHNTGSKNLSIIEVYGDSMEPTLRNGEPVFIDTGSIDIISGEIYLIRAFGELRLKRLERKMNGNIIVFSDNPAFTSEELTPEQLEFSEITIIGKMLASLKVHSGRLY